MGPDGWLGGADACTNLVMRAASSCLRLATTASSCAIFFRWSAIRASSWAWLSAGATTGVAGGLVVSTGLAGTYFFRSECVEASTDM